MDVVAETERTRGLRSTSIGVLASFGMALFYAGVVGGVSGSLDHLRQQIGKDWYLLVPIIGGFGVQVGLMAELRRRRRLGKAQAAAGAAGVGASAFGMVACCAHHVADLAPFVGATAAATFLYDRRLPFMLTGLGMNAVGIAIMLRWLSRTRQQRSGEVDGRCAAA